MRENSGESRDDIIEGRNAVTEALRAGRSFDKIFLSKGEVDKALGHIASTARSMGIVVVETDRRRLDYMSKTKAHQGVIAVILEREYVTVDDILYIAEKRGEKPFVLILDEISDPQNLGAIIRSAECAGVHGIIIPKRRSAGLTAIVGKASAGAVEYMPVARVSNLVSAIKELKEKGLWIYGADAKGEKSLWETDFSGAIAIVIGSEGDGISRLTQENCDFLVSIPMKGQINSLNASVSSALLIYEALRQKMQG
ncbi:23S rRNA (guanosine(2251)-2'-O)-methyltransferase RlmB [Clostridiaceae bacterium OttesenSCG-928-D20]|nr:23S rRNA (guanosine(2251)-2'-O)-methyltransferase RlmB [Clostridiaceae bacterium OttesenSCG-928-D20]